MKLWKILIIACLVTVWIVSSKTPVKAQLDIIKDRGELIVAVKNNSRPLAFLDESGELQGLEIDIAKKLAKELLADETAIKFITVTNQERLNYLLDKKVDLIIARLTLNTSRSRLVDFSPYYYLDGTGIISKNPSVNSIQDLTQAKIAVLKQSDSIVIVQDRLPEAKLIGVDSYQQAWEMLETGDAIAFVADQSILTGWIQQYPEYRLISKRLSGEPLAIGMPKGLQYVSLRSQINQAIATWRDSGWLQQRATYWGLP